MNPKLKLLLLSLLSIYGLLVLLSSDYYQSRQSHDTITPDLPITFAHMDHALERCVVCHHNYQDDTGLGLCLNCHRRDEEVAHLMEAQFHELCRSCHEERHLEGKDGGPTRHCIDCHQEDIQP